MPRPDEPRESAEFRGVLAHFQSWYLEGERDLASVGQ